MNLDIRNVYIGDSSCSRLYQGSDLIWDATHPDVSLNWISNGADDGAANPDVYFDTGFTPQLSTKVELKFETPTVANGRLFGCGNSTTANTMYNFNISAGGVTQEGTSKNSLKFFYRGGNLAASFTPQVNTPYTVTLFGTYSGNSASAISMTVNGTTYTRSMTASTNITAAQTAYIFRWHGHDNAIPSGVKMCYLKIWDGSTFACDYVPVLHWYNNQYVPCFKNTLNNTYIYNLGTDTPVYQIKTTIE